MKNIFAAKVNGIASKVKNIMTRSLEPLKTLLLAENKEMAGFLGRKKAIDYVNEMRELAITEYLKE